MSCHVGINRSSWPESTSSWNEGVERVHTPPPVQGATNAREMNVEAEKMRETTDFPIQSKTTEEAGELVKAVIESVWRVDRFLTLVVASKFGSTVAKRPRLAISRDGE